MADNEGRSEAPTERRLQQSRASGEVAVSREFVTLAVLGGCIVLLTYQWPSLSGHLAGQLARILENAASLSPAAAATAALQAAVRAAAPLAIITAVMAAAATFVQTRFLLNMPALRPRFARLDPRQRLRRMFGPLALIETLRGLVKLAIVITASWFALKGTLAGLTAALAWSTPWLGDQMASALLHLATSVLFAFGAIAGFDIVTTQWQHIRKLRMTRAEIRDEHRDTEGDPLIKRRIRQIQHQRARRRMMAAVPQATVVLTNPTHYAVALAYDRSRGGAPRVVAKGADEVAARIREVADKHRVPLVSNPPLARALFKVEIGAEIPAEHYRVVAEIIAYVWRLRGRLASQTAPGTA